MLVYALPIGKGKFTLWTPQPRIAWGELEGIDKITLMVGFKDAEVGIDMTGLRHMLHDNLFRPVMTRACYKEAPGSRRSTAYMMIWGAIWLIGMDNPLEDIISGLYLLVGAPILARIANTCFKNHQRGVAVRFKELAHFPEVKMVYSPRLASLDTLVNSVGGFGAVLEVLDERGFGHLREFYKRGAWASRWTVTAPTGMGTVPFTEKREDDNMRYRQAMKEFQQDWI